MKPLKTVHVYVEGYPDLKEQEITLKGYIHCIPFKYYKDNIYRYPWMSKGVEYLITNTENMKVEFTRIIECEVKYIVKGVPSDNPKYGPNEDAVHKMNAIKNIDNLAENISMRPATEYDIPNMFKWELESIDKRLQTDPKAIKFIERDARESVWKTRMIMHNEDTIGMLTAYTVDDGYWYIGEIYLIKEYRGKGIGSKILEDEISQHDKISLKVAKDNIRAFKLYKSLGFEIYDETDYSYDMRLIKT